MEVSLKHSKLTTLTVKSIKHKDKLTNFIKRKEVIICLNLCKVIRKISNKYNLKRIKKHRV